MSRYRLFPLLILCLLLLPASPQARVLQISLPEVERALDDYAAERGGLQQLLEERLQQLYDELEAFAGGVDPVYRFSERDIVLEEGCALTSFVEQLQGEVRLQNGSALDLRLISLTEPLSLNLVLKADLDARGRIEQERGVYAFGRCNGYAEYGFDFTADGEVVLRMEGDVTSRIEFTDEGIRYSPTLSLQAGFERVSYSIDVDDDLFASLVEDKIDDAIQPFLDQGAAQELSRRLERQFRDSLIESWGADYIDIKLPELDRQRLEQLIARFEQEYREDRLYLEERLGELYYFLLSADEEAPEGLLGNRALCELGRYLMVEMPSEPLYRQSGGECRQVESDAEAGSYYSDAACQRSVLYRPLSVEGYCAGLGDMEHSGRPATGMDEPPVWFRSPGARLDIGVESIAGNHLPYSSRTIYKQLSGPRGQCALEMEIYKRSPGTDNLKALLMLHGGSWQSRRDGLVGMESQVSHYTDQGFVVFMPTYRLVGETEGDPACNGANGEQIVADVEDALRWVQEYGGYYGSKGGPVAVLGQSAGGHLALRLAARHGAQIERMMLLYPASDFADFLGRWQAGELGEQPDGLEAMEGFVGKPVQEVRITDPVVVENTIPPLIARQPELFPPLFIVHGSGDTLVPVLQSVRLCNSLSGDPERGPVGPLYGSVTEGVSQSFSCDQRGSQLHVVTGGEHMLDGCLFSLLCPAGGVDSQRVVEEFLQAGRRWLAQDGSAAADPVGP